MPQWLFVRIVYFMLGACCNYVLRWSSEWTRKWKLSGQKNAMKGFFFHIIKLYKRIFLQGNVLVRTLSIFSLLSNITAYTIFYTDYSINGFGYTSNFTKTKFASWGCKKLLSPRYCNLSSFYFLLKWHMIVLQPFVRRGVECPINHETGWSLRTATRVSNTWPAMALYAARNTFWEFSNFSTLKLFTTA